MTVAGLACLTAIASAPLAITSLGEHGIEVPGLHSAQRLMAMLDARSPGERQKGELTKTKVRVAGVPRERALGKVFPPRPTPEEQLALVVVPAPPQAVPPVAPIAPPTVIDIISPASLIASVPLVSGSAIIGGSILPPPTPPPPISTVPGAVPEPGTWLMMLLGFGFIGTAMRRRPRTQPAAA